MKRMLICCLTGLVLLVTVAGLRAQTEGTQKAVSALEHQWLQAHNTSNPDMLAPLLAYNFVSTSAEGKVSGKSEMLADVKAQKWTSGEYRDEKVSVYGDTAIATGVFTGKGVDASGKPLDETVRWTDTRVKMSNGKWQCVASHLSTLKM